MHPLARYSAFKAAGHGFPQLIPENESMSGYCSVGKVTRHLPSMSWIRFQATSWNILFGIKATPAVEPNRSLSNDCVE
jgi:hypothetical protein